MTEATPPLSDSEVQARFNQLSDSAFRGCGQSDTLYSSRMMSAIDTAASRLPENEAGRFPAIATAEHDYVPPGELTPITANGCCSCGLDEMTCPNGHFE